MMRGDGVGLHFTYKYDKQEKQAVTPLTVEGEESEVLAPSQRSSGVHIVKFAPTIRQVAMEGLQR